MDWQGRHPSIYPSNQNSKKENNVVNCEHAGVKKKKQIHNGLSIYVPLTFQYIPIWGSIPFQIPNHSLSLPWLDTFSTVPPTTPPPSPPLHEPAIQQKGIPPHEWMDGWMGQPLETIETQNQARNKIKHTRSHTIEEHRTFHSPTRKRTKSCRRLAHKELYYGTVGGGPWALLEFGTNHVKYTL